MQTFSPTLVPCVRTQTTAITGMRLILRIHRPNFPPRWRALLLLGGGIGLFAPSLIAHTETARALAELSSLISQDPENAALYLRRAACWEEHANWAAAEADLKQAAALAPQFLGARLELARLYTETDRWTEGREELDRVLTAKPIQADARILRARVFTKLGQADAAYADYSAAIAALAEPKPELFLARAALPIDPGIALVGLDDGIEQRGPAITLVNRAIELELTLHHLHAAIARIDTMITSTERPDHWWHRRGTILDLAGRKAEARFSYQQALAALDRLPSWLRGSPEAVGLASDLRHLISADPPSS